MPHAPPEARGNRAGACHRESSGQTRHGDLQLETETIVDEEEEYWEPSEHDPIHDERNDKEADQTGDPLAAQGPIEIDLDIQSSGPPLVAADLREKVHGKEVKTMH
jgi:hypothetical protein